MTFCLFSFGVVPFISDITIRAFAIIAFAVFTCLLTAKDIVRYIKISFEKTLDNIRKCVQVQAEITSKLNMAVEIINQNTKSMLKYADLLNEMVGICAELDQEKIAEKINQHSLMMMELVDARNKLAAICDGSCKQNKDTTKGGQKALYDETDNLNKNS